MWLNTRITGIDFDCCNSTTLEKNYFFKVRIQGVHAHPLAPACGRPWMEYLVVEWMVYQTLHRGCLSSRVASWETCGTTACWCVVCSCVASRARVPCPTARGTDVASTCCSVYVKCRMHGWNSQTPPCTDPASFTTSANPARSKFGVFGVVLCVISQVHMFVNVNVNVNRGFI